MKLFNLIKTIQLFFLTIAVIFFFSCNNIFKNEDDGTAIEIEKEENESEKKENVKDPEEKQEDKKEETKEETKIIIQKLSSESTLAQNISTTGIQIYKVNSTSININTKNNAKKLFFWQK